MSFVEKQLEPGEVIIDKIRTGFFSYLGAALYLIILCSPAKLFRVFGTELALTNKRVIGRSGAYYKRRLIITHKDIETVAVRQGIFGSILGVGNLIVTGKDGSRVVFYGIRDPIDWQLMLQEANEMATLGRKLSQIVMD